MMGTEPTAPTVMESRTASALRLVGLARRAGAVAPGTEAVRRAIREGEAQLILMASDASSVQLDKIRKTLKEKPIPQLYLGNRNALGEAVGLAPLSAVAITAGPLAKRLIEELPGGTADSGVAEPVEG